MSQESTASLSPEQTQQLLSAGWWTSGDDRWFSPEQHPDPAHRAHFAAVSGPHEVVQQPAPPPHADASLAMSADAGRAAPATTAPTAGPTFPPLEPSSPDSRGPSVVPTTEHEPHVVGTTAGLPHAMAYAEPSTAPQIDPALATASPDAPAASPALSPLAQQMAEDARRKALPPMPELDVTDNGVPEEEWRRTAAANAAAMEASAPGLRRGSGKRAQRRSWLPISALFFVIAGLLAFVYYVPSVRTTFIETKAQITGEQVPVTVRPAPNSTPIENGMAIVGDGPISG